MREIERGKILETLETCLNASCRGYHPGVYCPIQQTIWDAIEDAVILLKEQEPRVMTLEEAINGNQVGYVEFRYHPDRGWVKCDFTLPDDEVMMMLSSTRAFYQQLPDYNRLWRLWTSRPTYEQMEATPWEMPEAKKTDGQD